MDEEEHNNFRQDSLRGDSIDRIKEIAHRRINSAMPFFVRIQEAANNVSQKLQSASELLIDPDLRKKGASILREGVKQGIEKGATAIGKGIEQGRQTISNGPRSLQQILENVQERLKQQHWERQLVLQKDEPVDVQIGHKLYEHAPQHLRTNFWLALLEQPELVEPLKKVYIKRTASHVATGLSFREASSTSQLSNGNLNNQIEGIKQINSKELSLDMLPLQETKEKANQWESLWEEIDSKTNSVQEVDLKLGSGWGSGQELETLIMDSQQSGNGNNKEENLSSSQQESQAIIHPLMPSKEVTQLNTETEQQATSDNEVSPTSNDENQTPLADEEWEVVKDAEWDTQKQAYRPLPTNPRQSDGPLLTEDELQQERAAMDPLMEAVFLRPEPSDPPQYYSESGELIKYPPDTQYAWLLELRRQSEVELVIQRDITRTFPKVPQFELLYTQKALFNVLRAYAQQDPEVGYCQGMAFIVGILLMYLDEEPAFRLFCRLMGFNETGELCLRKYYLPDLSGFKNELVKFEFLFQRHLPQLFEHMQEHGALAVLFAAPWFMTSFAASLPPIFSARIFDVMLVTQSDSVLHKMGIAILQELQEELLKLEDMESLCNHVKDEPTKWSTDHFRRVFRRVMYSVVTDEDLELAEKFLKEMDGGERQSSLSTEFSSEMMEAVQDSIERAQLTKVEEQSEDEAQREHAHEQQQEKEMI